jgi:hypothetical protein
MPISRITGLTEAGDLGLDEIIADNVGFHFERRNHDEVWFAVRDGDRWLSVNLRAQGPISALVKDEKLSGRGSHSRRKR